MPAAKPMKTPGVYIVETNAFPNSIVEVATAVPAFIGYTEKSEMQGRSLAMKPSRISSMSEFELYFGGAPDVKFTVAAEADPSKVDFVATKSDGTTAGQSLSIQSGNFNLHRSMQLFFQNGGGPCYIVSVGHFKSADGSATAISGDTLAKGIETLETEQEPTLIVIPDAVLLADVDKCCKLQQAMLGHCAKLQNRFSILDVFAGDTPITPTTDPVADFRNKLGTTALNYGAAYYPWLRTNIIDDQTITFDQLDNPAALATLIQGELLPTPVDATDKRQAAIKVIIDAIHPAANAQPPAEGAPPPPTHSQAHDALLSISKTYKAAMQAVARHLNLLPPSAAMAGIYTMVDNSRGVWKAPANVSINSVVAPAVNITNADQEDLNVTPMGKSINAIRSFIGEGVLVWGARTLEGNSLDWRYINVRRTMIMLEESCKLAAKAMVFEPNVAGTWVTIKSMIENFLTSVWKRGGLAGAVPADAFSVHVGLGDTMTANDILEGILRVTVLVAISHPAEFIEITFQQQMQKS
jgi:phage tail sheath protein FI